MVNFVPALAYHFCLNLPAAFTQPGARLLAEPCISLAATFLFIFKHCVTLQLLELCLCDVEEGVEELLPGGAALRAEVVPQGCAQVLEDHPDYQLELLPEDATRVVVSGDLILKSLIKRLLKLEDPEP